MVTKTLQSPSNLLWLTMQLSDAGEFTYSLRWGNQEVLAPSRLGLQLQNQPPLQSGLELQHTLFRNFNETWENPLGEARLNHNQYNEATLYLSEKAGNRRLLTLRFRIFDDGLAFRYEIPAQPSLNYQNLVIADELTEFNFDRRARLWQIPAYQKDRYEYVYTEVALPELGAPIHTPATLVLPSGLTVAVHEAALYNYGAMNLRRAADNSGSHVALESEITPRADGAKAVVDLPFTTPWRTILVGQSPLDLVTNRMILNLNAPPRGNFSWVRPLKFMGIWWALFVNEWTWAPGPRHGATTAHTKQYLDFCAENGIGGLLVEGWNNGWEGDWLQNGATTNFTQPQPDFDLPAVAAYARSKGVALIGHHETVGFVDNYERQLEAAYAYYAEHGIHYIKPGYANARMRINGREEFHHCQLGVKHYQRALELAAKYQIMLDVHEPIKGTGIERTWPNLLTREGARGQEYAGGYLPPEHMCILPFTRLLAGAFDNTPGIFDITNPARRLDSTLARQLAYYVIVYSGMQMLADRPKFYAADFTNEALGTPEPPERQQELANRQFRAAFAFLKAVPVIWEQTVPLLGEIGQYYVVARQARRGTNQFGMVESGHAVAGTAAGVATAAPSVDTAEGGTRFEPGARFESGAGAVAGAPAVEKAGDWYIGGVTNAAGRALKFKLDFLDPGATYQLTLYADAPDADHLSNPLAMQIHTCTVQANDELNVWLAPGGGFAARLQKLQ